MIISVTQRYGGCGSARYKTGGAAASGTKFTANFFFLPYSRRVGPRPFSTPPPGAAQSIRLSYSLHYTIQNM